MSRTKWDGWHGLLRGRRSDEADIVAVRLDTVPAGGGSGAFRVRGSDGQRYWLKPLNNRQSERVPITEQIVGRVGRLVGAPVCEVCTVRISDELAGESTGRGFQVRSGIAHGSREVPKAVESRRFEHRDRDDNASRYVGYAVLFDWCWGGDAQGLHAAGEDMCFFSHDHGWFLPPEGPTWCIASLDANVGLPRPFQHPGFRANHTSATAYADRLEKLDRTSLTDELARIPSSWPVSDEELECVGWFLERRAREIANKLREQAGGVA